MCKKFILAIMLIAFSSVMTNAGGVTNVKEIINNTSVILQVTKLEPTLANPYSGDYTREIAAGGGVWTGDIWVPWINNEQESKERWMAIHYSRGSGINETYKYEFFIWQSGDYVRYSKEKYIDNAPKVPGVSKSGGDRRMIISEKDKKIIFKFEKF